MNFFNVMFLLVCYHAGNNWMGSYVYIVFPSIIHHCV